MRSYSNDPASGVTKVTMQRNGERVTVLWTMSPGGATASVDALGSQALKVNKWGETEHDPGRRREILSRAGRARPPTRTPATAATTWSAASPVILVERSDGNVQAAIRSLDDNPVPGQVAEAASAVSDGAGRVAAAGADDHQGREKGRQERGEEADRDANPDPKEGDPDAHAEEEVAQPSSRIVIAAPSDAKAPLLVRRMPRDGCPPP